MSIRFTIVHEIPIIPYASEPRRFRLGAYALAIGLTACAIAAFAIVFPLPSILELLNYPPGTSMRPMGATAMIVLGAMAGLFVAFPLAVIALVFGRRRRAAVVIGLLALVLVCGAVFGDYWLFNHIVSTRGYVMEP